MHPRFIKPLDTLPIPLSTALQPILASAGFCGQFTPAHVTTLKNASALDDRALRLALLPVAAAYSIAPISQFFVGAIACGNSGAWYLGANMEFAGQGLFHSVHAEQSAISHAWLSGETGIAEITVNYTPCGHCRQFMNELNTARTLHISLPNDSNTLSGFLPHSFGPADLGITDALMSPHSHHALQLDSDDPLWLAALAAAQQSYAPYSQGYAGVALQFANGHIVCGRYAENAAFNPSLPPMQMACAHGVLRGEDLASLRRAVLLESRNGSISQRDAAQSTLKALGSVVLEYRAV
ncbi:cytidine deaminase [Aeromonas cavernicola]|uniref:Cytidine deaminase n=1 Tax=Aeromonas cavernicola TaxID=1006623 RepID=A0A2H9U1F5_9GAMM|nr:cytidine deaminase [Aeromonas cavernicola]PJG57886.1 cytidine deaminase [Aeromonas cavernicola]